jgi:two-component system OmpR family sensor kinase
MNRLWVRLTLAFTLVTVVTLGVVAVLANSRAGEAFRLYLSYSDPSRYESLVQTLSAYYRSRGSWEGVESTVERISAMPGQMMGRGRGMTFHGESQLQVVLAEAQGKVLYDGLQGRPGRQLTADELDAALDIEVNGVRVGRLVVALPVESAILGPLERRFINRISQLLLAGAVLAGALGVLLGLAMSRSLSAPLQRLASAARAVGQHDFSHRVQVGGSTEVAEVSLAFNEMSAALEQADELRKNLMADVAHELRTPLSVLQGNLQAILDDVYPLEKAEISRLYDQTRLLSRLVEDLRELALADAGKLHMNLQTTNLRQVLQSTSDHLAPSAEQAGVHLTVQAADLPVVVADPDRVAQVLNNLLANALRHTPAGGSIGVTALATKEGVEVTVADTGEGIAPESLPHIFDRFWRADHARTHDQARAGGSGLGLSIAQSLVRAQGGRIWVESTLGKGSIFHFTLPVSRGGAGV